MTVVWDEALEVSGTELMVLVVIADHAGDDTAEAWPSVARLAQRTRRSERSVQEALSNLEASGWLTRTMRPGHSTLYTIHRPQGGAVDRTPADSAPPQPAAPHPRSGPHPRGAVDRTQNHQGTTNETGAGASTTEGGAADRTTSSHMHVTEDRGFPRWAQATLASRHPAAVATPQQQQSWSDAWTALTAQVDTLWDPNLHLTRYLSRCEETRRSPSPAEWQRWFADDEMDAKRKGAAAAKAEQDQIKPLNPYWE